MTTITIAGNNMEKLTEQANRNRDAITAIKGKLLRGEVTVEQARAEAQPIIDAMNVRVKAISKEHGMPYKPLKFTNLMR